MMFPTWPAASSWTPCTAWSGAALASTWRWNAGVQALCRSLIADGTALSAHDCSDGGFAVALAESCILGDSSVGGIGSVGFTASDNFASAVPARWDIALFGEAPSRILVSVDPARLRSVLDAARVAQVPAVPAGETGGDRLKIGDLVDVPLSELASAWYGGLSGIWE